MKEKRVFHITILLAIFAAAWTGEVCALQKLIYSDTGVLSGSTVNTWDSYTGWGVGTGPATFNGSYSGGIPIDPLYCFLAANSNFTTYAGWGIFKNEDMSAYAGGFLKFWVKTSVDLKIEVKDTVNHVKYIASYGWNSGKPTEWQEVSIPLADFGANLSQMTGLFLITVTSGSEVSFYIDYIRYATEETPTLQEIKLYPGQSVIPVGGQKELVAVGYDTDGNMMVITPSWSVVSGPVSLVSSGGNSAVFQGNSEGPAIVRATVGGIYRNAQIQIAAPAKIYTAAFNIYSDVGLPPGVISIPQFPGGVVNGPTCTEVSAADAPEGSLFYRTVIGTAMWGGWWIELPAPGNMLDFESGTLKLYARSQDDLVVKIKGGSVESYEKDLTDYGWVSDNTWRQVSVPLVDMAVEGVDFSLLKIIFLVSTKGAPGQGTTFDIDYVRYETLKALAAPPAIAISGRQLLINGQPFTMRGVCYSPTPVGEGYASFDFSAHPEIYEKDLRLIKAMGANTIRIYKPPTYSAFLDTAFNQGLFVIMDYPVSHSAALTDPAVRNTIKSGFLSMINTWKDHPAVLMWNLGNEMNKHLNGLSASAWFSFVNTCAYEAHTLEGEPYHPVISAIAQTVEIGSAAYGATDSDLIYLDAWAVQVYTGPGFGTMFTNVAGKTAKPLLLTEFGCDAYDMKQSQENQTQQASYLQSQWTEIASHASAVTPSKICIGGTVFSWSDDWSKVQWGVPNSVHDTAGLYANSYYYDYVSPSVYNMNEEWWGICGIAPATTDRTFRQAYKALQSLWRGAPLMNVHIAGGVNLTWGSAVAGTDIWKVADNPITIEAADSYGDDFDVWGIQIFTDNTALDANPRYTGDTSKNFNIVGRTNKSYGLALCWKITDVVGSPGTPVWLKDRGDGSEGFTDYAWRWMKDRGQTAEPFVPGEEYVRVWDEKGIYWSDHVALDADPIKPGNQPCPAPGVSPNYVYIGVRLHDSLAQEYSTNKLIVEFIFP